VSINSIVSDLTAPNVSQRHTLHYLGTNNMPESDDSDLGAVIEPDNKNVFNPKQIKAVDVSTIGDILMRVGRLRFDTVFVRNLIFIVNLYRSVRHKLSKDLTYNRDIILKSSAITRPDTTEFRGNNVDTPRRSYSNDPRF